ncbi:MAG: hypothetical protein AAF212_06980 [Verrucomicrobiota bacterium]
MIAPQIVEEPSAEESSAAEAAADQPPIPETPPAQPSISPGDQALEDEFLSGSPEAPLPEPPSPATHSQEPAKVYTPEERQALAEKMLPPDVIAYLKEEFRAEFTSVRKIGDKKLY